MKTVQHGLGERGPKSRVTGELVCGPETLSRGRTRKKPRDMWVGVLASARRQLLQGAHRRSAKDQSAAVVRRELGRAGPASARQFRRFHARRIEGEMAGSARSARTGRCSTPTTASGCRKRFFDYFLKGEQNGWDKQPKVLLQVRHPGEKFVDARRTNGRSRARNGRISISTRKTRVWRRRRSQSRRVDQLRNHGRRRRRSRRRAAGARHRNHRAGGREAFRFVGHRNADIFAVLRRLRSGGQGSRVPGRARSAHAGGARLAARVASQARSETVAAVPAVSHARREPAA